MSTESHTDRNGVTWTTFQGESVFSDYWTTVIPAVYRDPTPGFTKAATRAGLIDDIEAYAATHAVPAGDPTPSSPPPPPAMESTPAAPTAPGGSPPAPRAPVSSSLLRALDRLRAPAPPPTSTMNTPGTSQASQPGQPIAPGISTQTNVPGLPLATSAQSSNKRWWVFGGVAAVLVGLGAAWGIRKKRQAPASPNALR